MSIHGKCTCGRLVKVNSVGEFYYVCKCGIKYERRYNQKKDKYELRIAK